MMRRKGNRRRWIGWLLVGALFASALTVGVVWFCLSPYIGASMDVSLLEIGKESAPSRLYAYNAAGRAEREGELHEAEGGILLRPNEIVQVSYEDIPPDLIHAFIAIEDKRFFSHKGVDVLRTAYAVGRYLCGQGDFGASTITQQLVKNLTGNDQHTVARKCAEIFMAMDLERKVEKAEILECYLNVINLAEGCNGVGEAARRYYSKEVCDLTLAECAAIAAITNNPSRYDPLTHSENNLARRNLILHEMADQGYITESACAEAMASDLGLNPTRPEPPVITSWYADMVATDVIRDLQERLGYTYTHASMMLYRGGLRIETAMDEALQAEVERYYEDTTRFPTGDSGMPQSSFILIDPTTGDILAVAGAIGKKTACRLQNYATDTRRPAGSVIKPLSVYAPALERGLITWASIYDDAPQTVKNGAPWPKNADGLYRGRISVGTSVAHSVNTVAVEILEQLGLENSITYLQDTLGMQSLLMPTGESLHDMTVSSLALGQQSRGVTVRELTGAYTAMTDGIYRTPISYHRVLDADGRVLLENPRSDVTGKRALSRENAAVMTRMLMKVTEEGTAARYMSLPDALGIEVAGKTGTTQNNCDRWFVGYTPRLLAGVWMGYDYPAELRGIEGNPCVTVWDQLMTRCERIYAGHTPNPAFDIPDGVISLDFCPLSGKRPNPYCSDAASRSMVEQGWFVLGTEPREMCTLHEEPPITIVPEDPSDPNRIPLLPDDILPPDEPRRWYSRWFSFLNPWGHGRS